VIGSLSVSVVIFTLLLKASTLLIDIPQSFWNIFSGSIILLVGLAIVFPSLWSRLPYLHNISSLGSQTIGAGYRKKSYVGDMLIGLALGPVFTTCSPTYLFIVATILPAGFLVGFVYLLGFTLGLAISLLLIAFFGGQVVKKITGHMNTATRIKKLFGVLIILVGVAILTGYDKKLETAILDSGYGATINFEESLIQRFAPNTNKESKPTTLIQVPTDLTRTFPNTNWTKVDPKITGAISGGPGKDGIPSIDTPTFLPLASFKHSDAVQAIVMEDGQQVKVYPYNILNWHEIVNDTVNDIPVAITFCPLCGSAIVYDRRVGGETLTFGVSGFLLESNMIMFDREYESLWQQSTGKVLAGKNLDQELNLAPFQRLTMGEVRTLYPNALVLSEDTGYTRDYGRNPYSGYEDSQDYVFTPSKENLRFPSKTIFVVFRLEDNTVGFPYGALTDGKQYETTVKGNKLTLERDGDLLTIIDSEGGELPFYFEMWFSFAIQHGENAIIFEPDSVSSQ
jgi:cytochrome c biogenesis protein CcdA